MKKVKTLTDAQLRSLIKFGKQKKLAKILKVCPSRISQLKLADTYRLQALHDYIIARGAVERAADLAARRQYRRRH